MYSSRQIEDAIASLPEEALTRDIVIPLLQEMGYKDVRYVHGNFEHGVDVLYTEETPFGTEFCGIQIKAVSIHGTKARKGGNVIELINQASAALRHRFIDERDNTEKSLDKYFVMTSASITDVAVAEIRDALREFGRTVRFVDGQALTQYVLHHLRSYVTDYFARRDLVAEFGHVLRTPLQGIASDLGWLRTLLARGDVSDRSPGVLDRAESHIQEISRKIRSYVQAVAPPKTLGRTSRSIYIHELANSIVRSFEARARMRGIQVKLHCEHLRPIRTDPDALELIIANLLDNAIKYSFDNHVVRVLLHQQREELVIAIEDVGLLIPQSELPLIWERFYRGTTVADPRMYRPGTGVGLAVVRSLVEELGGSVDVSSCAASRTEEATPNGLVRFTVNLPYGHQERET